MSASQGIPNSNAALPAKTTDSNENKPNSKLLFFLVLTHQILHQQKEDLTLLTCGANLLGYKESRGTLSHKNKKTGLSQDDMRNSLFSFNLKPVLVLR